MDVISLAGALVAGLVSAIAGHFVAHDLYEAAPKHAKRLLSHAVRILPESDRERYAEEWLAHLRECEGVFAKFRHAIECLFIARKLRRICEYRDTEPHGIEFVILSNGHKTANVSMDTVTAYPILRAMEEAIELGAPSQHDFVPTKDIKELFDDPDVDRKKLAELKAAIEASKAFNRPGLKIQIVDRFGRVLTEDQLASWVGDGE
jgi:hypothetical protein